MSSTATTVPLPAADRPATAPRQRLRLAIVTETYPPEINGVANTLWQMVRGLTDLGHEVDLIRPHQEQAPTVVTPAVVTQHLTTGLPLPGYPGLQFGLPAARLCRRVWSGRRPALVYIATEGPLGRSALKVANALGIPALTGMHTNFHQYSRHYGVGLLANLVHGYLRHFHNSAAGTLVPTAEMADTLRADGFERVAVWPRGVDAERFSPQRRQTALRRAWGLDDGTPGVVYVGRIAPEKNIDLVFRAFAAIRQAHPGAQLIVVGDGPERERLAAQHPQAIFTGPKTGTELAEHYASGDMFLFPSLTETFGNVVLEAMASGLGTLAFDTAAARELIVAGVNGRLTAGEDAEDFIAQAVDFASHTEQLRACGQAARATALDNAWPRIMRRLEQQFRTTAVDHN